MNYTKIPYGDTGYFSNTVVDYLNGAEALREFYAYTPELSSIKEIVANLEANFPVDRTSLVHSINEQYASQEINEAVRTNIDRLADSKTFTVTTAHQLNIFTGPLYYIYKILNAVKVARDLNARYPEYHFVPCYWMGSEDHDFEEVNHIHLFGKRITWENFQDGSLGSYSTSGITDLIPGIRDIIRQGSYLDELTELMLSAYSRDKLADAVREMLNSLFGEYGLVVIDGNCHTCKLMFHTIIKDELDHRSSEAIVNQQMEALAEAGYPSQAAPREINLFYAEGRIRDRIVPDGEDFNLADSDRHFSHNEMMALVEEYPRCFSPNVILRPLHQQVVLPNIAYIGGGSEIAYWMQLKTLFAHHHVHFPMLLVRTSAQIIAPYVQKNLDKLGLDRTDVFLSADELKKQFVTAEHDQFDLNEEKEAVKRLFEGITQKTLSVDSSMESWIGAEERKVEKILENISKKLIRAGKAKNESDMARIDKVKAQLFPEGNLQERHDNFMSYYADKGGEWFKDLLEVLDPFDKKFYLLH